MFHMSNVIHALGRLGLASYFLKAGINNARNYKKLVPVLKYKAVPAPTCALLIAIIFQIIGSLLIIFHYHMVWGALALALFTVAANIYFCNYWTLQGLERRNVSFLFYANIAVIGGLLLLINF